MLRLLCSALLINSCVLTFLSQNSSSLLNAAENIDSAQIMAAAQQANLYFQTRRNALISALENPDKAVRLDAIKHLARMHDRSVIPYLRAFFDPLKYSEEEVIAAIRAITHMGDKSSIDMLLDLRKNTSPAIQKAVYLALGFLESLSQETHAMMLNNEIEAFRASSTIGLSLEDQHEYIESLITALERDDSPHVRRMSAIAIGLYGSTESGPALATALTDPDPGVRRYAAEALLRLDYKKAIPEILMAMEANIASDYLNAVLMSLTGENFGFSSTDNAMQRRLAIDAAFKWYTDNAPE